MHKCDYKNCTNDATVKGHVYGHISGSGEKDMFLPVNACNEHRMIDGFFEEELLKSM